MEIYNLHGLLKMAQLSKWKAQTNISLGLIVKSNVFFVPLAEMKTSGR